MYIFCFHTLIFKRSISHLTMSMKYNVVNWSNVLIIFASTTSHNAKKLSNVELFGKTIQITIFNVEYIILYFILCSMEVNVALLPQTRRGGQYKDHRDPECHCRLYASYAISRSLWHRARVHSSFRRVSVCL